MQIFGCLNEVQRMLYGHKYGNWYYANEVYLEQFLNLEPGDWTVDEYSDQFLKLQQVCELEQNELHDLNRFIRGWRPNILQNMNYCKTIHDAYWEAIRVERMLKRSCL